jgi:hypothetical protein
MKARIHHRGHHRSVRDQRGKGYPVTFPLLVRRFLRRYYNRYEFGEDGSIHPAFTEAPDGVQSVRRNRLASNTIL